LVGGMLGCVLGRDRGKGGEEEERESVRLYIYHFTEAAQYDIAP
jgi:hypothetical protein